MFHSKNGLKLVSKKKACYNLTISLQHCRVLMQFEKKGSEMASQKSEKIGLFTAVTIGMNAMIGAGIFSITSLLGSKVGPAGILTYLFALCAVWFIAQSFARVAYLFPQEGSFYTYAKQWGGHHIGLISAGAYLLGLLIAMGLLSNIAGQYLHNYFPDTPTLHLSLYAITALVALTIFGMKTSCIGQYILLAFTIYPLIATTLLCLSNLNIENLHPFMPHGPISVLAGTKVAVFGLFGFESIASLFSIVKNPEKAVPQALKLSIFLVGIIYFIFIGSILIGIPQTVFILYPNLNIPQTLLRAFPGHTLLIQSIGTSILFAILGTVHAMIWSSSTLLLSYLKFLNFKWLNQAITKNIINSKTCVLLAGIVIATSCLSITNLAVFFSLADVCLLFGFITSIISLLFIKNEWKSGQNVITILGLISACIISAEAGKTLFNHIIMSLN